MLREDEFNIGLSDLAHFGTIGMNDHTIEYVVIAGRHKLVDLIMFDNTDATCTDFIEIFEIALRWDLIPLLLRAQGWWCGWVPEQYVLRW
jgi:hypothetical protein